MGVTVISITPKIISVGDTKTFIVVKGSGFKSVADVAAGELLMTDLTIPDDNTLMFHVSPQLAEGVYDVDLILKDESVFTVSNGITVTNSTTVR